MRVTRIRDTCPVSVKTSGKGNNVDIIIIMHDNTSEMKSSWGEPEHCSTHII